MKDYFVNRTLGEIREDRNDILALVLRAQNRLPLNERVSCDDVTWNAFLVHLMPHSRQEITQNMFPILECSIRCFQPDNGFI